MSADNRVRIVLVGPSEDDENITVGTLLKKVDALRKSLRATDRVISHGKEVFDYRVVDLSHSSPSAVMLEPIPQNVEEDAGDPEYLMDTHYTTLKVIEENGVVPEGFGYYELRSFRDLQPNQNAVPEVRIERNGDGLSLSGNWAKKVDDILGPDELEFGSVTGMLQQLNVHGKTRQFTIYPTLGEPDLKCKFGPELRDKVIKEVDRYVEVSGTLHYKASSWYPHQIDAESIRSFPRESQLPTLDDLFGIAPNATGQESIEDFVQRVRHGWG